MHSYVMSQNLAIFDVYNFLQIIVVLIATIGQFTMLSVTTDKSKTVMQGGTRILLLQSCMGQYD